MCLEIRLLRVGNHKTGSLINPRMKWFYEELAKPYAVYFLLSYTVVIALFAPFGDQGREGSSS